MERDRVERIGEMLSSSFRFRMYGLRLASVAHRPRTGLLGESYVLEFSNSAKRSVQVIFHPRDDENDYLLVNIRNDSTSESFNIEDWLRENEVEKGVDMFRLKNHPGDFETRVSSFVNYLGDLLENIGIGRILTGGVWQSASFNWSGMK